MCWYVTIKLSLILSNYLHIIYRWNILFHMRTESVYSTHGRNECLFADEVMILWLSKIKIYIKCGLPCLYTVMYVFKIKQMYVFILMVFMVLRANWKQFLWDVQKKYHPLRGQEENQTSSCWTLLSWSLEQTRSSSCESSIRNMILWLRRSLPIGGKKNTNPLIVNPKCSYEEN